MTQSAVREVESHHNFDVTVATYIDVVFSPDDGGWYLQESRKEPPLASRTSRRIYVSETEAKRAYERGQVKWTKWT